LVSEAIGEVEVEGGVLVLKRIHVRYQLKLASEQRATAERVHGMHAEKCPVARSIERAIAITTELTMEEG
jgi:organic hydroperoxide reductase OsmC/OhrA